MDLNKGPGESSSSSPSGSSENLSEYQSIINAVSNRLVELDIEEVSSNPEFRQQLEAHFNRLPPSYALYINSERMKDVLLHQKLLAEKDSDKGPVFHVLPLENFRTWSEGNDEIQVDVLSIASLDIAEDIEGSVHSHGRCFNEDMHLGIISQPPPPSKKLQDPISGVTTKSSDNMERLSLEEATSRRLESLHMPVHEVIFSMVDTPNLLNQFCNAPSARSQENLYYFFSLTENGFEANLPYMLSELLSKVGLHILEAHVFPTTDGHSLDVFVVDGWLVWETESVHKALEEAIARHKLSWSASLLSQLAVDKALAGKANFGDWEIDKRLLKIGRGIADGACGCLYRGKYGGEDVVVKTLGSGYLIKNCRQEVSILREVQHKNLVPFVGAYLKSPEFFIITEYMAGGSLFDYLRENGAILEVPKFIKFALDVSKGMDYLHQRNIIHRDLKAANVLKDSNNVLKVADFGLSRYMGDIMTLERGTYKWMAPEILNLKPYDQRADIFSFAIFLWELATGEIPYRYMAPIEAAIQVIKKGIRPEIPDTMHPKLSDLMQRCWDTNPSNRPSFSEIIIELENLLQEVQDGPVP